MNDATDEEATDAAGPSRQPPPLTLRRFLAIDERPAFIAFVQTPLGQLAAAVVAAMVLWPHFSPGEIAIAVPGALAAARFAARRCTILFAATWLTAILGSWLGWVDLADHIELAVAAEHPGAVASVLAVATLLVAGVLFAGLLGFVRRFPQSFVAKRPLVFVLGSEALLIAVAQPDAMQGLPRLIVWSFIFTFTPYLWFIPFAVAEARSAKAGSPWCRMAFLRPFWSPTYLPFGKGGAYLAKHLSKTPEDLAVTQLKGVKLLLWATVLSGINAFLGWRFSPGIPEIEVAIDAFLSGRPYPVVTGWGVIVLSTARYSLQIAMWAHLFIGIARLAGYRLPRGSWRPLESRTLMDYFNRFHFYFKELLVDYFFLPTFFRVFKKHPRLRMFFATFMAAGVGNALWHFLRDIDLIYTHGPVAAIESFTSYLFYCAILATGVGLSQVRANLGARPAESLAGRFASFLFVWSFVVCLRVFSDESRDHNLVERLSFMANLFGVNTQ